MALYPKSTACSLACPPPSYSGGDSSRRLLTFVRAGTRPRKALPEASLVRSRASGAPSGKEVRTFAPKIRANLVQKNVASYYVARSPLAAVAPPSSDRCLGLVVRLPPTVSVCLDWLILHIFSVTIFRLQKLPNQIMITLYLKY